MNEIDQSEKKISGRNFSFWLEDERVEGGLWWEWGANILSYFK